MVKRVANYFPSGISVYVPGAQYAADLDIAGINLFSLGTPAAESANNVAAAFNLQAAADTEVALSVTLDGRYGRNLRVTPSGNPGNVNVFDVYGYDYLGQLMIERFTGTNGSAPIIYGQKCFKKIFKTKIVTASTNAVTGNIGTGSRLGLPYKGDVLVARENNVFVDVFKRPFWLVGEAAAADAVTGYTKYFNAPAPGYVRTLRAISNGGGGGTDPVITVTLGGVAIVGLTVTTDTSVAAHDTTDTPTTPGYNANNRFVAGGLIAVVAAAAAGAFSHIVMLDIVPTQVLLADLTDPQTATTADPRGSYEPLMTLNGSDITVGMLVDNSVNTAERGGLYGIAHFGG